ncbi:MAG: PDZ domain-containing protein, partial [Acidimicrobiales bacterium]
MAVIVLSLAVTVLQHIGTDEYSLTPGDAKPVAPLVSVRGLATDSRHDTILLTDVYLSSLSVFQWIVSHFQSHVEYVTANELVDPGIPADELGPQGYLEMSDSKEAAEIAALRALGWTIPVTRDGAVIAGVVSPSPARTAGLRVADRIVSVDGRSVTGACSLVRALATVSPGQSVRLSVARAQISAAGAITWRTPRVTSVTVGTTPAGAGTPGCAAGTKGRAWLGVEIEDGASVHLPARITINTRDIGGPSAGLAMTLTLIDRLSSGSLTGGHVVAATGTIAPDGSVGDVGGVAE